MSLALGTRIGNYEVTGHLGSGGMGVVYRGRDRQLGREVALKVLPPEVAADPDRLARFRREARLLASLNHPNVSTIHGLAEGEGIQAIVLELVEGESLRARIHGDRTGSAGRPIPLAEALRIACGVARGLEAAHEQGIIHRDLKPENVKVTPDGRAKILDFGIAKALRTDLERVDLTVAAEAEVETSAGSMLGTTGYMSPEQATGRAADRQADIWAFGCLLYEMLVGRPAFAGRTSIESLVRSLHDEPDWSALPAKTPEGVRSLLRRCLEKDPGRRCRDIRDARLEIEQTMGPTTLTSATATNPSRQGISAAVLGVAFGGVVIVSVFLVAQTGLGRAIDSVAVLPFENLSVDPNGEYLSDGITENLIDRLSELSNLRVVPRGVSGRFTNADDLVSVGAALNVAALVTGSVREVGDRLLVRAELIDVGELANLWSRQYDRRLDDVLDVQADLVTEISRELRIRLSREEAAALTRFDPSNAEAYRLYLKSRHHTLKESPEGIRLGLQYALEAVDRDPTYSLAHAALADAYLSAGFRGILPREEAYPQARAAAEAATRIDESASQPRLELALVHFFIDWDWPAATREARRAVELDGNNADALAMLGLMECVQGDLENGLAHVQRSIELDPFTSDPLPNLAACYQRLGRFEDALAALNETVELSPGNLGARFQRPRILLTMGEDEAAFAEMRRALQETKVDPDSSERMAELYARAGRADSARALLDRLDLDSADPTYVAEARVALGEYDLAFESLERAYAQRVDRLPFMVVGTDLGPLHDDPRFEELRRRVHPGGP